MNNHRLPIFIVISVLKCERKSLDVIKMKTFSLNNVFGARIHQYLAATSSTLCILSSEMHFGWTSPSLPHLTNGTYKFRITNDEASWIAAMILVGTVVGALIAGKLTDIIGRKKVILMTSLPLFFGWLMIGFAENAAMIYVARFVSGLSSGLSFSTVPMYLGEIADPGIRGLLSSLCPVCIVFGILLINILGNYLPINSTAFVASIFPVILFITFIWMPESPSFLMRKNRRDEAEATLLILRGKDEAEKELERISTEQEIHAEGSIKELFLNRANRRAALIAYGLRTIQQFSGTTALTFYCKTIFEDSNEILLSTTSTLLYFSLQLLVAFLMIFVVDSVGRKPLLIVSCIGTTVTLFGMSTYLLIKDKFDLDISSFKFVPVVFLMLNVVFFSIGIRNVPLLMLSEIFSPSIKSLALGIGTIYYSVLAILIAKLFFLTNEMVGMYASFLLYGMLTLFGTIFVTLVLPETKGLTLEEIQERLQDNSFDGKNMT